ncbi:MAG: hypothetical protein HDT28_05495 [Clostridiales bacterium]|nr:hypothetical protein [Clostridiales bacterium]
MEHSDEKLDMDVIDEAHDTVDNADEPATPVAPEADTAADGDTASATSSGVTETIIVAIKTVAVALSLIIMLTVILAVGLPLQTMRIFNKLGNPARAIDFGYRYIARRLNSADANVTDEYGNYTALMRNAELSDEQLEEAIFVCSNLSYKLMESNYDSGNTRMGEYYAERTEKYTRLYMSMNNSSALFDTKSEQAMQGMPSAAFLPAVYSYGNTIRTMNYRARAYLGQTQYMAADSHSNDRGSITPLSTLSNTYGGATATDRNSIMTLLDDYVDYVDQLCEYLDVEYKRIGVENDLNKKVDMTDEYGNELENVDIVSETFIIANYEDSFKGNEFDMFIRRDTNGAIAFTAVYDSLKRFPYYAQLAVDFKPDDSAGNRKGEMVHQLYWLQKLDNAAKSLLYMEWLLQHNDTCFGNDGASLIAAANGTCQAYRYVNVKNDQGYDSIAQIINVYTQKMKEYLSL